MRQPRPFRLAVILAAGTALASACGTAPPRGTSGTKAEEDGSFPHESHVKVPCTDCHNLDLVLAGRPAVPARFDHQPCNREACHASAFKNAPGRLCRLCHRRPSTTEPDWRVQYPPNRPSRSQAAAFSHAQHLDYAGMERVVGFHVSCIDCHTLENGKPSQPGHRVCARCHAPESVAKPPLSQCDGCHRTMRPKPSRARRLIVGDLTFRHSSHRLDKRGQLIPCSQCHPRSNRSTETGRQDRPQTAACVACHDDSQRAPATVRMVRCEACHSTRAASISAILPRSHLPPTAQPANHTLAFRKNHGLEAKTSPNRCAACHTILSPSSRNVCDDCHRTMRPQSHVTTWREFDHGPEAAARSTSCARCHTAEFCISCHQVPPRSHFPLDLFRTSGHSLPARVNTRSCFACHDVSTFCGTCHQGAP